MDKRNEQEAISRAAERVRSRFPTVPSDTVDEVVAQYHHEYDGRPIREFVPILVERDAVDHLSSESVSSQTAAPA